MIQACLLESERKELKNCWDYLSVSILGSCLCYREEFVRSKLSVHQVYVKKNLVKVLTFLLQIIHDDERDLSLSEEEDDDEEENQGSSKEGKPLSALWTFFYRELTCFLIYPTINVFSLCSLHAKQ